MKNFKKIKNLENLEDLQNLVHSGHSENIYWTFLIFLEMDKMLIKKNLENLKKLV